MNIKDEDKPEQARANLFTKKTDFNIESDDDDDSEIISLVSKKSDRIDYSNYANPNKMNYASEDDDDDDEDDEDDEESGDYSYNFNQKKVIDPQEIIKKRKILIELKRMERDHGIELSHGISEKSALAELELEKDMHRSYLNIEETKAMYRMWLITFASTTEWMSSLYNPMNLKLKNWSGHLNENIHEFDTVFGELAEKWGSGKLSPEFRLIMLIVQSGFMYHMNQKVLDMMGENTANILQQASQNSGIQNNGIQNNPFGNFNPFDLMKTMLKPSPPPSAQQRQQMNQQMSHPSISPDQLKQELYNQGPLVSPPNDPHYTDGYDLKPQNTIPDYAMENMRQRERERSQSRFSVGTDDSGSSLEVTFKPQKGKGKGKGKGLRLSK